jgi:hypothetical protein
MRFVRVLVFCTVVICAALAATALAGSSAGSAPDYTATVTLSSVGPGSSAMFNATLTSKSDVNPVNAATIAAPQGFTITAVSLAGPSGNATVSTQNGQVVVKGLSLKTGQSASLSITASTPTSCGPFTWTVRAFKSALQDRNALQPDPTLVQTTGLSSPCTTPCSSNGPACTAALSSPPDSPTPSSIQVTTTPAAAAGTLTLSVNQGTKPVCGTLAGTPYVGPEQNFYGVIYTPDAGTPFVAKTITYTLFNTGNVSGIHLCFAAPYPFELLDDSTPASPNGTLPDGSPGFVGLLENCEPVEEAGESAPEPCQTSATVADNGVSTGFDTVFTITIPAGEPGDPWFA